MSDDVWASDDEAIAVCVQALRLLHANPAARRAAIAKLRESIAALRLPPPRTRLPEPKPIAPRFQQFYAAMATFWEHA
jgi:hypothetical protein